MLVAAIVTYAVYNWWATKRVVKNLTQEEFIQGYRKAQLIDVREPGEFDAGHILGARNIPMSQLKSRMKEIRPDKPVYLYCQSGLRSGRAAQVLYKKGYRDLYQLKNGFKQWTGKIKRK
ncbi:MAG: rhodanese-like domain-containing protein [Bacillus sp. (in: firmicutes)]